MIAAVWMRARADVRGHARSMISAALITALFGTAVLALLAGADRTVAAYPSFLERNRGHDIQIFDSTIFNDVFWKPDFDALARLPYVEASARVRVGNISTGGDLLDGVNFTGPIGETPGAAIDRPIIVRGRMLDPRRADEVTVPHFADTKTASGETAIGSFRTGDVIDVILGEEPAQLKVVGETVFPGEIPPGPAFGWGVQVSPAFLAEHANGCASRGPKCDVDFALESMLIRFRDASDLTRFDRDVRGSTGGKVLAPQDQTAHVKAVQRAADLQRTALIVLAVFIGLTGLLIVGQLLARDIAVGASDSGTLRALGMSRGSLFVRAVMSMLPVALGGAVLTLLGTWLASPLFPRGTLAVVDEAGFQIDGGSILAVGAVGLITVALTVIPGARTALIAGRAQAPLRSSSVASWLFATGSSVTAVVGSRLALERGRGSSAIPVRSSLSIIAVGIASVIAASGIAQSLTTMIDDPAIYGQNYDNTLETSDETLDGSPQKQNDLTNRIAAALTSDPDVEALAHVDSGAPIVLYGPKGPAKGIPLLGMSIVPLKDSPFPPILEGRAPRDGREVLLGTRLMRALGVTIDPRDPPIIELGFQGGTKRGRIRVVGRAVIPPLDSYGELGYGIVAGGFEGVSDALDVPSDAPPAVEMIVRWREGADPATVLARIQRRFKSGTGEPIPRMNESLSEESFADAVNFGGIRSAPLAVGAALAGLGAAALAHVVVTAIRRRRKDIAILKTLGFVRGQARRAVAWQASITVAIAAAIGIPAGIAIGRWVWLRIADGIGVLPRPEVSVIVVAVMLPAVVIIANVVAAIPARAAARTNPAAVLRYE